jgi:hypothetical protein
MLTVCPEFPGEDSGERDGEAAGDPTVSNGVPDCTIVPVPISGPNESSIDGMLTIKHTPPHYNHKQM